MKDDLNNLIFLGPQGSGKGTQAKLLVDKYEYLLIGAGESLREIAKEDSELGKEVHQTMNVEGRLVEPELIAKIIEKKIREQGAEKKIIVDGFPRTVKQYKLMRDFWADTGRGQYTVVYIDLSEEEAVKRLSTRYICEPDGEILAAYTPEQVEKIKKECEAKGGRLIQREDDKPDAVRMRLELFNKETLPMLDMMKKENVPVIEIGGEQSIEKVHEEIINKLDLR